jgi:hypothetical protein
VNNFLKRLIDETLIDGLPRGLKNSIDRLLARQEEEFRRED